MEAFLITFNIVVSIFGFSFMAWSQRDTRQILREQKELLRQMDANSSRIAEHSRRIAELVVQNGSALARVETLTQQRLTRMADEQTAHQLSLVARMKQSETRGYLWPLARSLCSLSGVWLARSARFMAGNFCHKAYAIRYLPLGFRYASSRLRGLLRITQCTGRR